MISLIVAIDSNNAIGNNNSLLWHIPQDLKYFKSVTTSHPIIMGRNTYYSIGRPLPGRRNIVVSGRGLTEQQQQEAIGAIKPGSNTTFEVVNNIEEIIKEAQESKEEFFVMGGGQLYKSFFDYADKLYITQIYAAAPEADTYFPAIDTNIWKIASQSEREYSSENNIYFSHIIYSKDGR